MCFGLLFFYKSLLRKKKEQSVELLVTQKKTKQFGVSQMFLLLARHPARERENIPTSTSADE